MCWEGKKKKQVADKDILCYKILKRTENSSELMSEYFTFVYELKKLYKTKICVRNSYFYDDKIYIYEGFHSYDKSILIKLNNYKDNSTVSVFCGHRLFSHVFTHSNPILMECIIPKGSIYYKNGYNEIVSNQIIINREIKWEDVLDWQQ